MNAALTQAPANPTPETTVYVGDVAVDLDALRDDFDALRDELRAGVGPDDAAHLRRVEWVGRAASVLGWATAWIPNPISPLLLSTGIFARWTMVAHHVVHRGYDRVPGVPERLRSSKFARGARRWFDWPDWMVPDAWRYEHNALHHFRLGESADPDQPELNTSLIRRRGIPLFLRALVLAFVASTWKFTYYAPNTLGALRNAAPGAGAPVKFPAAAMWLPWARPGRDTWLRSYLPYVALHFGLLPLPFLAFGTQFWLAALANRALAEVLTNLHSFIIIVPNHVGEDVYRFEHATKHRGEFYLRQIIGTANYATGGFANDFAHGWLNYQIEHHLFPDMSMLQYVRAQPRVREICARHGLTYLQESVWTRTRAMIAVATGARSMPVM
ncbi:MAG: fatty acid desaturase [Myxococcales bacterium]|nr:fatty acid desaturase [Myxococcales bacterium]